MSNLLLSYGAHYYNIGKPAKHHSRAGDLYRYTVIIGDTDSFPVDEGSSMLHLSHDRKHVYWTSGPMQISSLFMGVIIEGYQCGHKMTSLDVNTNLPYVNGCSTRQLFPPERIGDPTMQQLTIPPFTSEQVHHMHPTARVVYVLRGKGISIIGQRGNTEETELTPGMVIVLDPMCPHHFRTEDSFLTVIPVHVFSSTPASMESNHPMMNGTKEI